RQLIPHRPKSPFKKGTYYEIFNERDEPVFVKSVKAEWRHYGHDDSPHHPGCQVRPEVGKKVYWIETIDRRRSGRTRIYELKQCTFGWGLGRRALPACLHGSSFPTSPHFKSKRTYENKSDIAIAATTKSVRIQLECDPRAG